MKVIVQVIKKGKSDGAKQGRSQGGATGANSPAILAAPPPPGTFYSPMWRHLSELSWDTYEAFCSRMRSFEVLMAPTRTDHLSWGHLEESGATKQ